MKTMQELREKAIERNRSHPVKVAVAAAGDGEVLLTVKMLNELGLGSAVLFGDAERITALSAQVGLEPGRNEIVNQPGDQAAAAAAVAAVREGKAGVVMKGHLLTPDYLKAILNSETGLKKGKLVHLGTLLEIPGIPRLLLASDMGMVIHPTLAEKAEMIGNMAEAMGKLGVEQPKTACLGAIETVSDKMPDTAESAILSKMAQRGQIRGTVVDGPLSMDLALYPEALEHKAIDSPVAGAADILLLPSIQAGNILYKTLIHSVKAQSGTVIFGTRAPAVMTSRSDSAESKLNSLALALLLA